MVSGVLRSMKLFEPNLILRGRHAPSFRLIKALSTLVIFSLHLFTEVSSRAELTLTRDAIVTIKILINPELTKIMGNRRNCGISIIPWRWIDEYNPST